jgi:hypothetical protein
MVEIAAGHHPDAITISQKKIFGKLKTAKFTKKRIDMSILPCGKCMYSSIDKIGRLC